MQQRLVMTPKLQQALKLLQVPTLELEHILKQEIMQNPRSTSAKFRYARVGPESAVLTPDP